MGHDFRKCQPVNEGCPFFRGVFPNFFPLSYIPLDHRNKHFINLSFILNLSLIHLTMYYICDNFF